MPPKKSRRLPGGKVRRPSGRGAQVARPVRPLAPAAPAEESFEEDDEALEAPDSAGTTVSLEDFRIARPAPEPPPPPSRRLRDRRGRAPVARTGPTPMEVAALNYRHIQGDLLRIAVLAAVMFGIIIALSFVIK